MTRAYRTTIRFYQGGENKKLVAPAPVARPVVAWKQILVERTLPSVPEEAAALALAVFRSLSRAPEVKLALASNVLIFALLGASMLMQSGTAPPAWARSFVASAAVAVTFMGLVQLMFNHFGFDRGGFRSLVLLPAPRRHVLLGKNLAVFPIALATFGIYLGLTAGLAHLGAADVVAAGLEFGGAFLALSVMGNLASVCVPYRISAGSLKPTKLSGLTQLMIFAMHLLFPLAMVPVFVPAGLGLLLADQVEWLPGTAITLLGALLFALISAVLYWRTLEPLGRLFERREQAILQVVTQEVE